MWGKHWYSPTVFYNSLQFSLTIECKWLEDMQKLEVSLLTELCDKYAVTNAGILLTKRR